MQKARGLRDAVEVRLQGGRGWGALVQVGARVVMRVLFVVGADLVASAPATARALIGPSTSYGKTQSIMHSQGPKARVMATKEKMCQI